MRYPKNSIHGNILSKGSLRWGRGIGGDTNALPKRSLTKNNKGYKKLTKGEGFHSCLKGVHKVSKTGGFAATKKKTWGGGENQLKNWHQGNLDQEESM